MKTKYSILKAAVLFCWLLAGSAVAQQAGDVFVRDSKELGFQKYTFESNAPKGSLVVFRKDAYLDDRLIDRYEVISKTPVGKQLQKVVFINSGGIKVDDENMAVPNAFKEKDIGYRTENSEPSMVKAVFEGIRNNRTYAVTYIFTMKTEPTGDVFRRVPGTASSEMVKMDKIVEVSGWTYCVDYSNISHPMSTALQDLD